MSTVSAARHPAPERLDCCNKPVCHDGCAARLAIHDRGKVRNGDPGRRNIKQLGQIALKRALHLLAPLPAGEDRLCIQGGRLPQGNSSRAGRRCASRSLLGNRVVAVLHLHEQFRCPGPRLGQREGRVGPKGKAALATINALLDGPRLHPCVAHAQAQLRLDLVDELGTLARGRGLKGANEAISQLNAGMKRSHTCHRPGELSGVHRGSK